MKLHNMSQYKNTGARRKNILVDCGSLVMEPKPIVELHTF